MADPTDLPQTDPRGPVQSQLSTFLPSTNVFVTGHNDKGQSIVAEERQSYWNQLDDKKMAFHLVYTNEFKPNLNDDDDLKKHNAEGSKTRSLVKAGGTVIRQVDFEPGYQCLMHRTQSLDYGIVTEGEVEMILEDGPTTLLRRGDIAVQRGTIHAWRNPSDTQWTRMTFILQESQPIVINGQPVGEQIDGAPAGIDASAH